MIARLRAWLQGPPKPRCNICLRPIESWEAYCCSKRPGRANIYTHLACDLRAQEQVGQMLVNHAREHSAFAQEATR